MESDLKYPIKYISNKTGLSQLLLRTWENRYNIINPVRTETNRRMYSDDDLNKLLLIRDAISNGFKIGELARMSVDEISEIVENSRENVASDQSDNNNSINDAIEAVKNFNSAGLKNILDSMLIKLSRTDYIIMFILPLLKEIGNRWESGELRISNEHFASAMIRNSLGSIIDNSTTDSAPPVVIASPVNQNHELAGLAIAALISIHGFRPVYLGASVPAEDIILTVSRTKSIAIVLSTIYPSGDLKLIDDLKKIRAHLSGIPVYIGGSAADWYLNELDDNTIKFIQEPLALIAQLKKK